jgi:hypothetical protein
MQLALVGVLPRAGAWFLAGLASIVLGLAFLRLMGWAELLALVLEGVVLVSALLAYFRGQVDYLAMLPAIAIVWYLNQGEVRESLRRRGGEGEGVRTRR